MPFLKFFSPPKLVTPPSQLFWSKRYISNLIPLFLSSHNSAERPISLCSYYMYFISSWCLIHHNFSCDLLKSLFDQVQAHSIYLFILYDFLLKIQLNLIPHCCLKLYYSKCLRGPATWVSPGSPLEMQNLRHGEQKNCVLIRPPKWFMCILKFEKH